MEEENAELLALKEGKELWELWLVQSPRSASGESHVKIPARRIHLYTYTPQADSQFVGVSFYSYQRV